MSCLFLFHISFRRACAAALVAGAALLFTAAPVAGQAVRGSLLGTVTDSSGGAIPGVTVTVTEVGTNVGRTTISNESGNYTFSSLKDGTYRVEAELQGFKKVVRDGVRVDVNTTIRVDMAMEVGDARAADRSH
jgi:hypothetical protein